MTLIIFARYNNGCIIIADRQASLTDGMKRSVKKICSRQDEYYLSLAGDGVRIEQVYQMLQDLDISKDEILEKIKTLMNQTYFTEETEDFEGVLLVKTSTKYEYFRVNSNKDNAIISKLDSRFESYGVSGAGHIARFLGNSLEIETYDLEKATDGLISIMKGVSKQYDGISEIDIGYDIVAISGNSKAYEIERFTEKKSGEIKLSYIPSQENVESLISKLSLEKKSKKVEEVKDKPVKKQQKKIQEKKITKPLPSILPPSRFSSLTSLASGSIRCKKCGKNMSFMEASIGKGMCTKCSKSSQKD